MTKKNKNKPGRGQQHIGAFLQNPPGRGSHQGRGSQGRSISHPSPQDRQAPAKPLPPQQPESANPITPPVDIRDNSQHSKMSSMTGSQEDTMAASMASDLSFQSETTSPSKKAKGSKRKQRTKQGPKSPTSKSTTGTKSTDSHNTSKSSSSTPKSPTRGKIPTPTPQSPDPEMKSPARKLPKGSKDTPPEINRKRPATTDEMELDATGTSLSKALESAKSSAQGETSNAGPAASPAPAPALTSALKSTSQPHDKSPGQTGTRTSKHQVSISEDTNTAQGDDDSSLTLKVNLKTAPTQVWMKVFQKIKPVQTQPLQPTAFTTEASDQDLPGMRAMLEATRLRDDMQNNSLGLAQCDDILQSALAHKMNSGNVFYHRDAPDEGLSNKSGFLSFTVRLAGTPADHLPSWDPNLGALVNPGPWELLWYAAYKKYGAVANTHKAFLQQLRQQRSPASSPGAQPAAKASSPSSTAPGGSQSRPRTSSSRPMKKTRKSNDRNRKYKSFYWVKGPVNEPYDSPTEGSKVMADYFVKLVLDLRTASPDCIINRNHTTKFAKNKYALLPDMDVSKLPQSKWDVFAYTEHMYVTRAGHSPQFVIEVQHDETPANFLKRFHENIEDHGFHLSLHAIQQWKTACSCWFLASNQFCDLKVLAKAIMDHQLWKHNFKNKPQVQIYCLYQDIKVSATETIPWGEGVKAVHVYTRYEDRNEVLSTITNIYAPTARKTIPLCRKYQVLANGGDKSMAVSAQKAQKLEAARDQQKKFLKRLKEYHLEDAIRDPDSPVFGGGPSFRAMLAGLMHPDYDKPLLLSFDQHPTDPSTYIITFDVAHGPLAHELLDRLYMYWKDKYGESAAGPFEEMYVLQQEAAFSITAFGIVSAADKLLADVDFHQDQHWEHMDGDSDEEEERQEHTLPAVSIQDIRIKIPTAFSCRTLVKLRGDDITKSTRASLKVDAATAAEGRSIAYASTGTVMDTQTILKGIPFKSIWDVPGMPPKLEQTQWTITDTQGAMLEEIRRMFYDLKQGLDLAPPDHQFQHLYLEWEGNHGHMNEKSHATYSQPDQRRMLLGMMHHEHIGSEDFFFRYQYCSFDRILELFSQRRLLQAYPNSSYFGSSDKEQVVALPVFADSLKDRQLFYYWLHHHPNKSFLHGMKGSKAIYLFALACYQLLGIDSQQCPKETFAQLFGLTITQEDLVALENTYVHHLQQSTHLFRSQWGITVDDTISFCSFFEIDSNFQPPTKILQEAPSSYPPRISTSAGDIPSAVELLDQEAAHNPTRGSSKVQFAEDKKEVQAFGESDASEDEDSSVHMDTQGIGTAGDQLMQDRSSEEPAASDPKSETVSHTPLPPPEHRYCLQTVRPYMMQLEAESDNMEGLPAQALEAFEVEFSHWYNSGCIDLEPYMDKQIMMRVMFKECIRFHLNGKVNPAQEEFRQYLATWSEKPYSSWIHSHTDEAHWEKTTVLFPEASMDMIIQPCPRGHASFTQMLEILEAHPWSASTPTLTKEVVADLFYSYYDDTPTQVGRLQEWLQTQNLDLLHHLMHGLRPSDSPHPGTADGEAVPP